MKLQIQIDATPSGLTQSVALKLFGCKNPKFSFHVCLKIPDTHLPLFCNGSEHVVGFNFEDSTLHGKGCHTALSFKILHPFTKWIGGVIGEYRLVAEETTAAKLEIETFITLCKRACQSKNVFLHTTFGQDFDATYVNLNETKMGLAAMESI